MDPGTTPSQCRNRMDLLNILNKFTEKYLHRLDRSSVDSLLKDGDRLVGDLTDLELEYCGFSLMHQLIWISFSAHNSYLRPSSLKEDVKNEPPSFTPPPLKETNLNATYFDIPSPQKNKKLCTQVKPPSIIKKRVQDIQLSIPKVPHQDSPFKKKPSIRKSRGSSILELPVPSIIHAPETPEISHREASPTVPYYQPLTINSIPETELPDFIDEEGGKECSPPSPILSRGSKNRHLEEIVPEEEDLKNSDSPSILSMKPSGRQNKWGITASSDSTLSRGDSSFKQGKIQGFLKPSQRYEEPTTDDVRARSKSARALLQGFDCEECRSYYKDTNLSEEQVKNLLKSCSRHRSKAPPPSEESQNERWELEIRDDDLNRTQMGPPLKVRKKRKTVGFVR